MSFRRAARVDANQSEIVNALRAEGWTVLIVSQLKRCCDVFASRNGRTVAIEIKDGSKPKSAQKLTDGEQSFSDTWQGEYKVVTCIEDVIHL